SSSSASLRSHHFSEPGQHPLGYFQFTELSAQLFPFSIQAREPLRNLLLLLSNLVQRRHLFSSSFPHTRQLRTVPIFCNKWASGAPQKDASRKLLPLCGGSGGFEEWQVTASLSSEARSIRSLPGFYQRSGHQPRGSSSALNEQYHFGRLCPVDQAVQVARQ